MDVVLDPKLLVHMFYNSRIYQFLKAHAGHQMKVSLNHFVDENGQRKDGDIVLYCQDCTEPMVGFVNADDQRTDFEQGTRADIQFVIALLQQAIDTLNKTIPYDFDSLHD